MSTHLEVVKNELPEIQALISLNSKPGTDVATIAKQELVYLEELALYNPVILDCEPLSIVLAVKRVMKQNLTLDPDAGLVYVTTRNVKVGDTWKKALKINPSANGLISINRQTGNILDFTRPKVDKDASGKVVGVSMRLLLPSTPEPRWEDYEFDESDFRRWQVASHKENSRGYKDGSGKPKPDANTLNYANPNYTNFNGGIDPEFARAKCIRHSVKKLGTNVNEKRDLYPRDFSNFKVVDVAVDREAAEEIIYTGEEIKTDEEL